MMSLQLNDRELQLYRDALAVDEAHTGPCIPQECFQVMKSVLRDRGIEGHAEKVTVQFGDVRNVYELHYSPY